MKNPKFAKSRGFFFGLKVDRGMCSLGQGEVGGGHPKKLHENNLWGKPPQFCFRDRYERKNDHFCNSFTVETLLNFDSSESTLVGKY